MVNSSKRCWQSTGRDQTRKCPCVIRALKKSKLARLTKFRKTRITEDILEEMLRETIRQAIERGLIKSTAIIVDSTHTTANARPKTVTQVLGDLSKQLRRGIYHEMKELLDTERIREIR